MALFAQQYLLAKIYALSMTLSDGPTAEASVALFALTRQLEADAMSDKDS